jgi:nucleotide-binding universal stress UspA family protein
MESNRVKRILVAVDESPRSIKVVERAAEIAGLFHAKIILVHVRQKVPDVLGEPFYQNLFNHYMHAAEQATAPLQVMLEDKGIDHEVLILEGDPAQAITEAASNQKCELIVMGTRGLSNLAGMALGSVSHKVLQVMDRMVLIVP